MAPARRLGNARATIAGMKAKQKTTAGRARGPARGGVTQLSDDEYRRLAKQQHEAEGEIEIDPSAKVSRSEDDTGEIGAYVQAWVFVHKPECT
jgi:hypothetical protein